MEKIEESSKPEMEWDTLVGLASKISDKAEEVGSWEELANMVVEAIESEEQNDDAVSKFFNLYAFLFRLYYRVKNNPEKRSFNQLSKLNIAGKETYRLTNYDYKMYKWAKAEGFANFISNDFIDMPADKLTTKQRQQFDSRIGE